MSSADGSGLADAGGVSVAGEGLSVIGTSGAAPSTGVVGANVARGVDVGVATGVGSAVGATVGVGVGFGVGVGAVPLTVTHDVCALRYGGSPVQLGDGLAVAVQAWPPGDPDEPR